MKIWSKSAILAVAILGVVLAGCGSSSSGGGNTTTDSGTTVADTTKPADDTAAPPADTAVPPADTAMGDMAMPEDTGTPVTPTNACTNAADDALFNDPAKDVSGKTGNCGVGCIGKKDAVACAQPCIIKDTGVTSDCAMCLAIQVDCAIKNCIGECAADPGGKACCDCRVAKKCVENFSTCSGRALETCE